LQVVPGFEPLTPQISKVGLQLQCLGLSFSNTKIADCKLVQILSTFSKKIMKTDFLDSSSDGSETCSSNTLADIQIRVKKLLMKLHTMIFEHVG